MSERSQAPMKPENASLYVVHQPGGPSLFPRWHKHPYFIHATDFVRSSAGIKVLHLLCHTLNQAGARAFVTAKNISPELNTPILTRRIIDFYNKQGITPIVVYGETISGNPMRAACVVRYLLNFSGHLGGDRGLTPEEFVVSYAKGMRQDGGEEFVLHLPVANTSIFHPPSPDEEQRAGSCFYAAKYKDIHRAELLPITNGMKEITRFRPDSQTVEEIAELFRKSEFFYCYENSTLSLEAVLSGCPVVLLPNKYFDRIIASDEYSNYGFAWGDSPEQKEHAQKTVKSAPARYELQVNRYWLSLQQFIERTQVFAATRQQTTALELAALRFPKTFWGSALAFTSILKFLIVKVGVPGTVEVLRTIMRSSDKWTTFREEMKRLYGWVRDDLLEKL